MKNLFKLFARSFFVILCLLVLQPSVSGQHTVGHYLENATIGQPVAYGNLRIFPIITQKPLCTHHYTTLDQASDNNWLTIKEIGSGTVNTIKIKNDGSRPVFIMAGEIVSGAKQDRMVAKDVLLPARSGWTEISVFCVEHGRWKHNSAQFKSEKLLVPNSLRTRATHTQSQSAVWNEIECLQDKACMQSGTGTVVANYKDEKTKNSIETYAKKLSIIPTLSPTTIGVVATAGNRIIGVDIFANNDLLRKLWPKLVKSYAMDALYATKGMVETNAACALLDTIQISHQTAVATPGIGQLVQLDAPNGKGAALVDKPALVHMNFFPDTQALHDDWKLPNPAGNRTQVEFLTPNCPPSGLKS